MLIKERLLGKQKKKIHYIVMTFRGGGEEWRRKDRKCLPSREAHAGLRWPMAEIDLLQ